jgi:hypothetical protein
MAFLIGVTSISFSMDMHFCQGNLKSINLFGKAKDCHALKRNAHKHCHASKAICHPKHKNERLSGKACCTNKLVSVSGLDHPVSLDQPVSESSSQTSVWTITTHYFQLGKDLCHALIRKFRDYKPPLPDRNLGILFQVFRN